MMSDGLIIWSPGVTLEIIEKQIIMKAFRYFQGNKTATAQALGICIRTLDNKFEKYEIDSKVEKERAENAKREREDFLKRQRGSVVNTNGAIQRVGADPTDVSRADAGVRMESATKASAQSPMPLSERPSVQVVLPKQTSQSGQRGRR